MNLDKPVQVTDTSTLIGLYGTLLCFTTRAGSCLRWQSAAHASCLIQDRGRPAARCLLKIAIVVVVAVARPSASLVLSACARLIAVIGIFGTADDISHGTKAAGQAVGDDPNRGSLCRLPPVTMCGVVNGVRSTLHKSKRRRAVA